MPKYPAIITGREYHGEIDSYSHLVSAPGPYLEFGEFLYLEASSTDASATVRFSGKFLSTDNEIRSFTEDMVITGTGNQTAVTSRIGPCWLLGFSVRVVAGTITDREIVASVHVARASASTPVHVMTLASGEVTNTRALGLGAFTIASSVTAAATAPYETPAVTTGSDPAAGAEWSVTVPANTIWKVYAVRASLVTDATVASRQPAIIIDDGATTLYQVYSGLSCTASATFAISWAQLGASLGGVNTSLGAMAPFPLWLAAGYRIRSSTGSLQAGDNWGAPTVLYTTWTV